MGKVRGLVAAVLAYVSWGPLAPLGALLLTATGPFTLNVYRTAGALILFGLVLGRPVLTGAFRLFLHDPRVWLLGVVGLAATFGAYLTSLLYLDPTIAALTIFLAPLLIALGGNRLLGERLRPRFWVTLGLTLAGGTLAVLEPSRGALPTLDLGWGLLLGVVGAVGWSFYTLYLKHLGQFHGDGELTLGAFLTSGVAFLVVAVPFEQLRFEWSGVAAAQLGLYIIFPSFVSFQLYAIAVRHAGATLTSVLLGVEVAATAFFSYFLIDEPFSPDKILGIAIVMAAVTYFLWAEARATQRPGGPEDGRTAQPPLEPGA